MRLQSPPPAFLERLRAAPTDEHIKSAILDIRNDHTGDATVVAHLANVLAESGKVLAISGDVTADVASTGGPTSLSTLLTPLFLRVTGAKVPKIGVPGRPAGGIDCLAQIPGFKTEMSMADAERVLASVGYVHFLAKGEAAPLDGRMFEIRQHVGAQAVPELVVASLLAKKLAVGVKYAGLDVRVAPHGNFGDSWTTARKNAQLYIETAELLGIKATPVLTDARYPYQPFLGRRESLVAIDELFQQNECSWLREHFDLCRLLALACVPNPMRSGIARATSHDLERHFEMNLNGQGATYAEFKEVVSKTRTGHNLTIASSGDGFCAYPLRELRATLIEWQTNIEDDRRSVFPDPVGIIFLARPGDWVERGAPLATVRAPAGSRHMVSETLSRLIARPSPVSLGPTQEMVYG